jgi:two-component system response regulator FixJ
MVGSRLVHVVDDDDAVRDSLGFLLESAGYEVKTYESAVEFLAAFTGEETGCLLTDVRMPELTGLEMANRLKRLGSKLPIVVMTGHADVPLAVQAMKAGAKDFIEKPFERETLLRAVKGALAAAELPQAGADDGARAAVLTRMNSLSTREQQILMGLIAGKPNKAMARELGISPRTVEVYRGAVMIKMQASSLSQLVRMAVLAAQIS